MSGLNVLIAGASIAGPATAYWLAKAGATVTVIERFPELRTGGQAIDIRTAGVSVMRKIPGMEAKVRAMTEKEEGICFVRDDGRPYGIIRASGNPDQQSLISEYEILRGNFSRILFDLTKDNENVKYIFEEQIGSMQDSQDGVTVEFLNGTSTTDYDLVVACDGATSRTRAMGLGCGVRDHIFPSGVWAAYFSIQEDLFPGSTITRGISAVKGRFISVGSDPGGFSRISLMSVHSKANQESLRSFREALAEGEMAVKKFIARYYEDMSWKTSAILEQMMDSKDLYASEIVQVKVPKLCNGRLVFVGDAGYAAGPTGGGTSLALTGAYMLAGEICKHEGDLSAGIQGYEERMRPLIKEMQKIPPFVSTILAPQTAWGIWIRNNLFALVAWSGIADFVQKYLGAAFADTKEFPLPDYDWAR